MATPNEADQSPVGTDGHRKPRDITDTVVMDFDTFLAERLERFSTSGPVESAEQLLNLLPPPESGCRQFVLIELIKMDMALMAEVGQVRLIDFYLGSLTQELPAAAIPLDLVLEEIQLRKQLSQTPSRQEYVERFPQFESLFAHLHQTAEATLARQTIKPAPDYAPHTQIDDFLVIQTLGKGAFATVYLAKQLSMQRPVALKVSLGKGEESQSLARFDHANIVRVFDQRNLVEPNVQLLYMQFLAGGTLADVVKLGRERGERSGQVLLDSVDINLFQTMQSIPEASTTRQWIRSASWVEVVAWIGTQLAFALDHAHGNGVFHRDVKPANVLLTAEGVPKLADFNVSFAGVAGRAGAAAALGGSIGYMAPEHLRAICSASDLVVEKVEEPADLYALAILLWELWQGQRPFLIDKQAESWSEAIQQQLKSRSCELVQPQPARNAAERALEQNLRRALALVPADRPRSGAEFAGRLKLTLHPQAANLFDMAPGTWREFVLKRSPWLVAIVLILTPNIVGGFLNFQYNYYQVMTEEMRDGLEKLSWFINLFFFPLGAAIIVYFALTLIRAVTAAKKGGAVSEKDVHDTLRLSHRASVIGGTLWLVGGIAIPVALSRMFPEFTWMQAVHLLISSLICGGVAMIYPFFGMTTVSTWVYYPLYLSESMRDRSFHKHRNWVTRTSEVYLLIAALIPLLGAALTSWHGSARTFTLLAIVAGMIGLLASFFVQRAIVKAWSQMAEVLE